MLPQFGCHTRAHSRASVASAPWGTIKAQTLKKRPDFSAPWSINLQGKWAFVYELELSRLYEGTHFLYFESIPHLAYMVSTLSLTLLKR
eukprot:341584-Amphidinium_carterae.3